MRPRYRTVKLSFCFTMVDKMTVIKVLLEQCSVVHTMSHATAYAEV